MRTAFRGWVGWRCPSTIAGVSKMLCQSTAGGDARRLTFDHRPIIGPLPGLWTAREIVFYSTRGGPDSCGEYRCCW